VFIGAVMVITGLLMTHIFASPIIVIRGLTPEHVSAHGLYHTLGVIGSVIWVTVGGVILVNGLILRWVDPNWRPDRRDFE
jgi:hypothetical protein